MRKKFRNLISLTFIKNIKKVCVICIICIFSGFLSSTCAFAFSFFSTKNTGAPNSNVDIVVNHPAEQNDNGSVPLSSIISPKNLQKIATVIAEIKRYYVKPVKDDELFDNAISGMLYGLDPHSEYLKKDDLDALEMITVGKFGGIGVEVVPDQGLIKVIAPLDDTPAARAGIKAGDIIVQINNKLVKDMQSHEAIKLMRGPKGSRLTLTILRKNMPKPIVLNLKRDMIKIKSVKEKMLEPGFGYLRIALFQETTDGDVIKAINNLKKSSAGKLNGLIIDLRNNPGGLLESAIQVTDNFIDARKLGRNNIIVYTKGNEESAHLTARATSGELLPKVPIVVLINEGSASAAEVAAGALQDYKRAIIVGTKSFGKGSVQTLLPVDDDSAIKLTTALYYTPLGRSIQAKGIVPDIVVSDLKIPAKVVIEDGEFIRIDETSLIDHLQNGNDAESKKNKDKENKDDQIKTSSTTDADDADSAKDATDDSAQNDGADNADNATEFQLNQKANQTKNQLALARKDYQLYEALNILKALAVTQKK